MSPGTAIVVLTEHQTAENRGRMAHVLNLAHALEEAKHPYRVMFCGKSVEWLPQLTSPDRAAEHPFVRNYGDRFDAVRGRVQACNFCCIRFDVREQVQAAGVPIVGEGKAHATLADLVIEGWQLVTF